MQVYDDGGIDFQDLMRLLEALRETVENEDGSFEEATRSISRYHCGKCLRKMRTAESLYDLSCVGDFCSEDLEDTMWENVNKLVHINLCTECFDDFMKECGASSEVAENIRKNIEENCDEEFWVAP